MADFVHLHNHSEFSLLDGLSKIPAMVARAKDLGMTALAITDHGALYGALKFYHACREAGIKPIIGCEIYVAKRSRFDKEANIDSDQNHLILLAKNNNGYKNLMRLVTAASLEGFYYKPRADLELLKKYHQDLICLTACLNGYISEPLLAGRHNEAEKKAKELMEIFGQNLYFELQKHPNIKGQEVLNLKLIELSEKLGVPLVATNDCHYIHQEDAEAQEILLCVQTQKTILDKERKLSMIDSPDFYLKSSEEMTGMFIQYPAAIENTAKIAKMCDLEIETGKWVVPKFDVPGNKTSEEYLKNLVYKNLKERYPHPTKEIKERVEYELSVIFQKHYTTYFLIVYDLKKWAREQGIAAGPGRGSVAGSIVSYILKITELDPLTYGLPFERFLNPQRPTPPDFDLDFADDRRDEVIAYVTKKYGEDKVAQIITFGTMEARGSVRDVGRALGMPYSGPDRIAKLIPHGAQGFAMTIEKALEQNPELSGAYKNEPEIKRLLDLARKLEGVTRHASTHAAGVVIADKELTEYTPLQKEARGERIITQYDMYDLDLNVASHAIGLLKIDFLGLRNLTILEASIFFVKQNQKKEIDLTKIPLDDKAVYALVQSGETTGIFQLESAGMRRLAKDLKPTKMSDLAAMVALFRPGPMAWIDDFISAKNNQRVIHYPHDDLKPILSETYGIAVYQEQCMQIPNVMAGYTLAEADNFRKAIGKKKPELMKKEKERFIKGCIAKGYSEEIAEEVFALIEKFVGYGFNKSHSASYALIAYQTAYMKTHFPVEFMTALLTAESRGSSGPVKNEKIAQSVAECRRVKIPVLPPDINKSESEFTIEDGKNIRFGLSAIKNVGQAAIESILQARQSNPFTDFNDFCLRVDLSKVNKKTIESLIKSGALDLFGNRANLLIQLPTLLETMHKKKKQKEEGQTALFDDLPATEQASERKQNSVVDDFSQNEKLAFEKEFLGIYLTSHPQIENLLTIKSAITHELGLIDEEKEGTQVRIGGIIESTRRTFTKKNGYEMAFLALADENGITAECIVFPKVFEEYKSLIVKDSVIVIEGQIDAKSDRPIIIVKKIQPPNRFSS
ncbi:MAG: DNA polymerase III subunit alpha [Candidatus Levybacteria bacterium]|nr:DNA polymerase III subunit alpha [Candidatus Levybacteria bacterium]MBI2189960.1 DNA polymerase III subunit alpha [Candidatus Levybacteria bacterium]MBI3069884.1 DNA polymerase III subunit alpha [Candidatus Levybacteria bacterium]